MARPQHLELPPSLDSQASSQLLTAILALRGDDLELDASHARRLGGLCLQILLAARACWAADGHRLTLHNVPEELTAGLSLFGINADLSTPAGV
jgi:chemotaxis protein CheX